MDDSSGKGDLLIFVYGTLRKGGSRYHYVKHHVVERDIVTLKGYRMVDDG